MNPNRILVVDDEEDLCEILQFNLETEGYVVDVAYSAEEALKLDLTQYVMMGEMSGFKMARVLREDPKTAKIPIIFLTARDTENDKLTGFNIGADDYIAKPFSIREVVARVKAVIRRFAVPTDEDQEDKLLVYDGLIMNLGNKKVTIDGEQAQFTKKEFEILRLFLEYRNRVFTRDEILSRVWTEDVIVLDRTIDVNITRLRKKIGQYGKNIVTRLGYGYCFES